ncbi:GTPase IMAP family member 8-like [Garra rufa]|uniref:GTPase IMAP family member 8-like n=1 Tax=Garra rufa TaxID=137080 RepID=UPI003CCE7087
MEQEKQLLTINGNEYFFLSPGKTFKPKEDIIRNVLEQVSGREVFNVKKCDAILVLCFIVSRAGTDIDAALIELEALLESKPAVFMVLHHTFEPEKVVPDSSRYVTRENTLTVDCFFNEDEGLLKCVKNADAAKRIRQWLQPQETQVKKEISISKLITVLLGTSVCEKTAVEHMILGHADTSRATQMITVNTGVVDGEQVAVINTPDWFSSGLSTEEIQQKIQFCINWVSQKPYTLLLVMAVKQFREEGREIMEKMQVIFQDRFCETLMIIFTATNEQEEQEIQKPNIKKKWAYHILNISQTGNRSQVPGLLKVVKKKNESCMFM